MPMRLGRLQRQSRRAFRASAAPEVSTSELAGWCWAKQTLMEKRALSRWQRESMIRAARSLEYKSFPQMGHSMHGQDRRSSRRQSSSGRRAWEPSARYEHSPAVVFAGTNYQFSRTIVTLGRTARPLAF